MGQGTIVLTRPPLRHAIGTARWAPHGAVHWFAEPAWGPFGLDSKAKPQPHTTQQLDLLLLAVSTAPESTCSDMPISSTPLEAQHGGSTMTRITGLPQQYLEHNKLLVEVHDACKAAQLDSRCKHCQDADGPACSPSSSCNIHKYTGPTALQPQPRGSESLPREPQLLPSDSVGPSQRKCIMHQ